jgi:hypothetical protein
MSDLIELIFSDERGQKILREAMERLDLSETATIRYFCRMGQLVDHQIQQGYQIAWMKDGEVVDPFDVGPKMAPMPPPVQQLSCGCDVGCCICDYEKD